MKRRSRIAEVMAAVPTAAQAACRMKSRREYLEKDCWSIKLPLNDVLRRIDNEIGNPTHAVAHLRISQGRAGRQPASVGDDLVLCSDRELAGAEQGIELID